MESTATVNAIAPLEYELVWVEPKLMVSLPPPDPKKQVLVADQLLAVARQDVDAVITRTTNNGR